MSKIPKIAVCMSGMIRNYHHTFDRFKKYIIEPLNPDIFVYTHGRTDKDEDFLVSNYKPIKYLILPFYLQALCCRNLPGK